MPLDRLHIDGAWFVDGDGRRVLLRGVNLGGDCKVPYPDGHTNLPTDFSDHREVSFVGRPFPLGEAHEHFSRLKAWGFNCLRLLTTWEAVEHAGPGDYDEAYLDYYAELCRRAGDYDFYVFVDFHQDVWSRMSGGDGAPCWLFEKAGLDYRTFHAAGAAHVMQYKYDFARGGRQEDNYPTMTWSQNYRLPVNGIMWTLFFAGRDFAPDLRIDGENVQDYMQRHYAGALAEVARRIRHLPNVLGFDTLNEPGTGYIGDPMSYVHLGPSEIRPRPARPGPAWSPLDGLAVARGFSRTVPHLAFSLEQMKTVPVREETVNPDGVSIWADGARDPFEQAGAYRIANGEIDVLREDFFERVGNRKVDLEEDYMAPFFNRVADTVREENADWLIFAELDPATGLFGGGFPDATPARSVNASHWYDIVTLATKTFNYPTAVNPFSGRVLEGRDAIAGHYKKQLGRIKAAAETLNGGTGAPTLIGECGIPFDLDDAAAYKAWDAGDRSGAPWEKHVLALELMYDALDELQLNSTQWNYTASNRNDQAVGDGWNQEDLSIFSRDQQTDPADINSGGRALEGFVRPYARRVAGAPEDMRFDRESGTFRIAYRANGGGETELFVPDIQYPDGYDIRVTGGDARNAGDQLVTVTGDGTVTVEITRR